MTSPQPSFAEALLAELARHPEGISLPRRRKRLDVRVGLLGRTLAWLGEERSGGVGGAGLVRVERRGEAGFAVLTERAHDELARRP